MSYLRFQMLKAWICQPDFSTVEIEEKHKTYAGEERRDKYVTVTCLKFHLDHL